MVVCFNCSQETKQLLDTTLQSGGYRDYGEVIATAIANLSILQGEVARSGAIVIGDAQKDQPVSNPRQKEPVATSPPAPAPSVRERKVTRQEAPVIIPPAQPIPERLLRNGINKPTVQPAAFPDDVWAPGATVPLD